jgi:putative ATPase
MILWGPLVAARRRSHASWRTAPTRLRAASAVFSGVADLRKVFEAARKARDGPGHLLFVDEIHRFNRAQQDAFLPYVEDGTG